MSTINKFIVTRMIIFFILLENKVAVGFLTAKNAVKIFSRSNTIKTQCARLSFNNIVEKFENYQTGIKHSFSGVVREVFKKGSSGVSLTA